MTPEEFEAEFERREQMDEIDAPDCSHCGRSNAGSREEPHLCDECETEFTEYFATVREEPDGEFLVILFRQITEYRIRQSPQAVGQKFFKVWLDAERWAQERVDRMAAGLQSKLVKPSKYYVKKGANKA